ncbi:putative mitochondrial ribosomal protein, L48 [Operophtera brumata]|uniref:Putative mitochondrial ribosomal protein, L48 n=1 Tax=Operophtera brumata TaxID=104452 RepID=A0A0L7KWC0_OPEBR|nr:putative mitochondrial ribosomal protein, L48 [Operophtera brumata]
MTTPCWNQLNGKYTDMQRSWVCSWATPAQQLKVQRYKPGGTVLDAEYKLNGCSLRAHEHAPEHEEVRYVPDNQLLDLKQQLEGMGGARPDKRKGRK